MTRQQEYIRKNVQRINFTYRKKYDYRLYNFFERLNKQYKGNHIELSRNRFVKDAITYDMSSEKDDIKLDKELYQSFPEGMKYSSQFPSIETQIGNCISIFLKLKKHNH